MLDEIEKAARAANRLLLRERRKIEAEVDALFKPHLRDSGFRVGKIGESRPLQIWTPRNARGQNTEVKFRGQVLTELVAFTEVGLMTDNYGGGCVTIPLCDLPLKDLLMFRKWAVKNVPVMNALLDRVRSAEKNAANAMEAIASTDEKPQRPSMKG